MTDNSSLFSTHIEANDKGVGASEYPMLWKREMRGGYGYIEHVPCRVLAREAGRVKVAALRKDGTEDERWIASKSLRGRP